MSTNKKLGTKPEISKLPMAQSDTPLVIDLPDGQKLVVGKMQTGTVIEVATWRGTGRPDSRTNRMMLGVSLAGQAQSTSETNPSTNESSNTSEKKSNILKYLNFATNAKEIIWKKLKNRKNNLKPTEGESNSPSIPSVPSSTVPSKPVEKLSSEVEIDEWLSRVKERRAARLAKENTISTKKSAPKKKNPKRKK